MDEDAIKSEEKRNRSEDGHFLPGHNIISPGRPKGQSIKDRVRKFLEEHPDDMQAFVNHFVKDNRELTWQMLEGRPKAEMDIDGQFFTHVITRDINQTLSASPETSGDSIKQ